MLREVVLFWVLVFYAIGGNHWEKLISPEIYYSSRKCKDVVNRITTYTYNHLTMKCELRCRGTNKECADKTNKYFKGG